jgi:ppGpp synthetase/RelA/SpoT-type nucleotidyltranferase
MAFKDKASAAWSELKQKLQDKGNQRRVKEEIKRRLQQGREAIDRVEKALQDPENRARMENKLRDVRERLKKAKAEFDKKKAEAVNYAKENPEKALVIAAAAGAMAGALWSVMRRKK